jgi:hypothetical protein
MNQASSLGAEVEIRQPGAKGVDDDGRHGLADEKNNKRKTAVKFCPQ